MLLLLQYNVPKSLVTDAAAFAIMAGQLDKATARRNASLDGYRCMFEELREVSKLSDGQFESLSPHKTR